MYTMKCNSCGDQSSFGEKLSFIFLVILVSVFTNDIKIRESNYIAKHYWAQLFVIFLFSFFTFMLERTRYVTRALFGSFVVVYLFYIFTAPSEKAPKGSSLARVMTKKGLTRLYTTRILLV